MTTPPSHSRRSVFSLLRRVAVSRRHVYLIADSRLADLAGFLFENPGDAGTGAVVAAELALRSWLARRPSLWPAESIPDSVVPPETRKIVADWLETRRARPELAMRRPFSKGRSDGVFARALERSLERWLGADGFLPLVVRGEGAAETREAVAVPFFLRKVPAAQVPGVVAEHAADPVAGGVPGLFASWERACEAARACLADPGDSPRLQVVLAGLGEKEVSLPEGLSATAPFFVAMVFRTKNISPPAWVWCASGDIDPRTLRSVSVRKDDPEWAAKTALGETLGIPAERRFFPWSWPGEIIPPESFPSALISNFHAFRKEFDVQAVEESLDRIRKTTRSGAAPPEDLDSELQGVLKQLETRTSPRSRRARALALKLRADIACHLGRPDRCLLLLEEAGGAGGREKADVLVRSASALLDQWRLSKAKSAVEQSLRLAESLNEIDALFVRRSALGTRGRILSAEALESGEPALRRAALADLRDALRLTRELEEDLPRGQRTEEPRNLCYILGWHALFEPQSEKTGMVYQETLDADRRSGGKSEPFVHQAAHLAAYRALLSGAPLPLSWWPAEDIPLPEPPPGWVAATARKYRATVLASQGETNRALALFREALDLLENTSGLLSFIRATILLQAAESLAPDSDLVRQFLADARSAFEEHAQASTLNPESLAAPQCWLGYARELSENKAGIPSPQMVFPY